MGLQKSTFKFLADLANNNDRNWFSENRSAYEEARADVIQLAEEILISLKKVDFNIPAQLTGAKSVFRIYRDIRFSKDKSPYKTYMGIWVPAYLNQTSGPGYYLHLEPNASFLGAGYWMPSSQDIKLIRQEIDYETELFKELTGSISNLGFQFNFEESLKRAPKDYNEEHQLLEFLKLKSFEIRLSFSDILLYDDEFVFTIVNQMASVVPYVSFLRKAIDS